MHGGAKKISLNKQILNCVMMCFAAVAVILFFHENSSIALVFGGAPLIYQVAFGLGLGGVYWAASQIGYRFVASKEATRSTIESYCRLDLSGWNPLWISIAAGFGEELLFRGALQPLLGVPFASVLFVIAHARAYRFSTLKARVLVQSLGIFFIGLAFGYIALYAGLITAMITHTLVDFVGLRLIRSVVSRESAVTGIKASST
jgi:membrane protease YdiL (CAAX protease family)